MSRLVLLLLFFPSVLFAQQLDSLSKYDVLEEQFKQQLSEELEQGVQDAEEISDVDAGEYLQALNELKDRPLNIHEVEDERFASLLRFSEYQRYQLRRYIDLHGIIQSPQELAAIEGFSVIFVQSVLPYIAFGPPEKRESIPAKQVLHGKSELLFRYGRAFNARETEHDEGSADALLLKYSYRCAEVLQAGFVLEKDGGESFFRASNCQGFDYRSGYVRYKGKRWLKQLLFGDYQTQFGQGLAMGMGFQFADVSPEGVKNVASGLKAHTSASESQFMRGAALSFAVSGHWDISCFFSVNRVDATVENGVCQSLTSTGFHRTLSERQKERQIRQDVGGSYVSYHGKSLHVGSGVYFMHYDLPVEPEVRPYNIFRFRGQKLWNAAADFLWNYRRMVFFGEAALDPQGHAAWVFGLLHPATNRLQFSAQLYHYPIEYQAIPDALKGSGSIANDQGMQYRARLLFGKRGVCDLMWKESLNPWLKYQMDAPSRKSLCQFRCTLSPWEKSQLLCTYRWKQSQQQLQHGNLRLPEEEHKHTLRLAWTWNPSAVWKFQWQWDGVAYNSGGNAEKGVMGMQACTFRQKKLQLHASFAFFNTDSYQTAVYVSERDVLYAMSLSSFSGSGYRANLLVSWKLAEFHTLYVKFGSTYLPGAQTYKSEVKVQWIWKGQNRLSKGR